ncbi:MAG: hypothetical protein Q8R81_01980 [Novosphingobium sp.]|uniref:hypothetical protein n=1 Tax=Novosphingobium sp. TaxID=1874826 RepID=UPI0027333C2C|nr:hypothetical protein [Novosphingobium sp.]MDP3549146.1 hypothetical protein [Novosphingobium sp.]
MKQKPNYKLLRRARLKKLGREQSSATNLARGFNIFLTTVISVATLAVAVASYLIAEKQTEVSIALAKLEIAKNQSKFSVVSSGRSSAFRQSGRLIEPQISNAIAVIPEVGVREIIAVNGQASIFFSTAGAQRPCVVAIRGLFMQSTRDKIHIVEASAQDLQKLIDAAANAGLRAEGFYTDVLVSFTNLYGDAEFANLGEDGSALEMSSFGNSDITIYAGAWSGGKGFYLDYPISDSACPIIGTKVRQLVERTKGHAGDGGVEKLPPTLRRELLSH